MQNTNIRNKYNEYSNKYDEQYKNLEDTYATVQFQQKTVIEKVAVVAKVGGAIFMTPYIKGLYDYAVDGVCSVFSSEEQDL